MTLRNLEQRLDSIEEGVDRFRVDTWTEVLARYESYLPAWTSDWLEEAIPKQMPEDEARAIVRQRVGDELAEEWTDWHEDLFETAESADGWPSDVADPPSEPDDLFAELKLAGKPQGEAETVATVCILDSIAWARALDESVG